MSLLNLACREEVRFSVDNVNHRQWFAEYRQTRSWAHCPVRFLLTGDSHDVVHQIQNAVTDYYLNMEFPKKESV